MMEPAAHAMLSQWEAFYVIVGSSAGGLTGLMFVVLTFEMRGLTPGQVVGRLAEKKIRTTMSPSNLIPRAFRRVS